MASLQLTIEVESVNGFKCQECDAAVTGEDVVSPLYECGPCGTKFTRENSADGASNRCPDCNKFAAKIADNGCPECNEGEVESLDGFKCPTCDDLFDAESIAEHVADCLSLTLVEGSIVEG